ncbi:flavodoxin [Natranaerovirga hydrolytica]|uniref:Flavodoxin n=1 Tax=Natranaerovirga hydrolytica TaxID=680378 RepID=A0A4V2Q093_9FIRM|nr:flavodoxin family protein [Natranaerovirga hydrolytica]TCK92811.1 flavodoxin [Natranaerovirga hydrolytica]
MDYIIIYSSETGNTKKVAYEIFKSMPEGTKIYDLQDIQGDVKEKNLILGYWVDRAKPNKEMLHFMECLTNKNIVAFGTLGAYPDSEHAQVTKKNVAEILEPRNTLLGQFLCQGRISSKITEMFKRASSDSPHRMTEERIKKHQEAAKHPNEEDFKAARSFIESILNSQ